MSASTVRTYGSISVYQPVYPSLSLCNSEDDDPNFALNRQPNATANPLVWQMSRRSTQELDIHIRVPRSSQRGADT